MSRPVFQRLLHSRLVVGLLLLVLLGFSFSRLLLPAYGAQLGRRSLQLSDASASAVSTYKLSFTLVTAGTLGSVSIQLCSNDPFVGNPCTVPAGFDAGTAVLSAQSGQTGFAIDSADSNANTLVLSRTAANAGTVAVSYTFQHITNPSAIGSYFARVQTFASSDASGSSSDYGGIAFAINNNVSINAEVPPYLIFCTGVSITGLNCANATGDQINFGEFSSKQTSQASSQMLTATNAGSGYTITMSGTTLTSGNDIITALSANDVSRPGTPQFGLNLRANSSPSGGANPTGPGLGAPTTNYNQPNFYRFNDGEIVASTAQPEDLREYTISYIANVPATQAPGVYVSTVTYVCLATF